MYANADPPFPTANFEEETHDLPRFKPGQYWGCGRCLLAMDTLRARGHHPPMVETLQDALEKGSGAGIELGAQRLRQYPALAAYVTQIIGVTSQIYVQFGHLVALMLGAQAEPVIEMFQTMRGDAQIEALDALAKDRLAGDALDIYLALVSIFRRSQQTRHAFAHQIWAISPNLPDAIILVNPRNAVNWMANTALMHHGKKDFPPDLGMPRDQMLVYREADLAKIADDLTALDGLFGTFAQHFMPDVPWRHEIVGRLLLEPRIQAEVATRKGKGGS